MDKYLDNAKGDVASYFLTHNISSEFYVCLFGELIKIFGIHMIIPDKHYDVEYDDSGNMLSSDNDSYSYKDQIEYYLTCFSGTSGWTDAFERSCDQLSMFWLQEDYSKMDWVHSDIFDGYIADRMIDTLFA